MMYTSCDETLRISTVRWTGWPSLTLGDSAYAESAKPFFTGPDCLDDEGSRSAETAPTAAAAKARHIEASIKRRIIDPSSAWILRSVTATIMVALHTHSHLSLFVNGKQLQIPQYIGIVPTGERTVCLYWIHTHDPSGVIHVEAPEIHEYTLGNFFDIWGEDLRSDQVGPYHGPVTAFVNGGKYDGDVAQIPLRAHQQITLEVGTPVVPPPNYSFPVGL